MYQPTLFERFVRWPFNHLRTWLTHKKCADPACPAQSLARFEHWHPRRFVRGNRG